MWLNVCDLERLFMVWSVVSVCGCCEFVFVWAGFMCLCGCICWCVNVCVVCMVVFGVCVDCASVCVVCLCCVFVGCLCL